MAEQWSRERVAAFWAEQARRHGQSPAASWSDFRVIELEVREILKNLEDGDHVLDIGCGNGFSTVQWAAQRRICIQGIDRTPEMIAQARLRLEGLRDRLAGSVEFAVGDVTILAEPDAAYDKVIAVRVIINLGDWSAQEAALRASARVLRPGGLLLLSEATLQGWRRLNRLRAEWGLAEIPMPPFNNYLDEDRVVQALAPELDLAELNNFASTYYVGTRVLKPLLARLSEAEVDVADPGADWNRWCAHLPAWGDYGTQKLFVFRKR